MPGYITKRSKSSYTVVVDLGRDPVTGKRRQLWRSVKGTKRAAEDHTGRLPRALAGRLRHDQPLPQKLSQLH